MTDAVPLASLRDCLRTGLASPLATCAPDGTPHVSRVSLVQYLDPERIATSRQAFNRALADLDVSPYAQAFVLRPATGEEFRLDLRYLHTVGEGEAFETARATLDAVASDAGVGAAFRLRGLDVHHVERCTRVPRGPDLPTPPLRPDPLLLLEQFARRLERPTTYAAVTHEIIDALDDLFGFPYAVLIAAGDIEVGHGLIGTATSRRRMIVTANLARARAMAAGVVGDGAAEVPLTGLTGARSAAAIPLVVGDAVFGALYVESTRPSAFGGPTEGLLRIIGAHAAAALAARSTPLAAPARTPAAALPDGPPPLRLVRYASDDTVLCDSAYVVKGAPGRILWSMLTAHAATARTEFTNRELRLDETLGLPAGNANLEARLLALRRRLATLGCGVAVERVGRGRLELRLARPVHLTEIPKGLSGQERTAAPRHAPPGAVGG